MSPPAHITLHDCAVDLRIPALSSLVQAGGSPTTLESLTSVALSSAPRSQARAYLGETLFAVLHVRAPQDAAAEALPHLLERVGDVRVYLSSTAIRPAPRSEPIRAVPDAPKSQRGPGLTVLAAGEWVADGTSGAYARALVILLRTAPDASRSTHVDAACGAQRLEALVRERVAPAVSDARDAVAAISRSTRAPARDSVCVIAAAALEVAAPLVLQCVTTVAADREFVVVRAENVTQDAHLDVIPPAVRVATTRVITLSDPHDENSAVRTAKSDVLVSHPNAGTVLQSMFEFAARFILPTYEDGEEEDDDDDDEADLSMLIPAFSRARKRLLRLQPGERFNFVFEVVPRSTTAPRVSVPLLPRLHANERLESAVAVAWSVHSDAGLSLRAALRQPLREAVRLPSSGGVLSLGTRRRVAVRVDAVRWQPHSLADGVVVALSGPPSCEPRAMCDVRIAVRNQRDSALERAVLCVRARGGKPSLTPLRTAVALGGVPPGDVARLSLACVALDAGALPLGDVCVVERAADGNDAVVWAARAPFEVLVTDASPAEDESVFDTSNGVDNDRPNNGGTALRVN